MMRDAKGRFIKGHPYGLRFGSGQKSPITKEKYRKISAALKGRKVPAERLLKMKFFQKGHMTWNKGTKGLIKPNSGNFKKGQHMREKNVNWRGGITPINKKIRESIEYEEWRKSVFERDNYTCLGCFQIGGYLQADHIKPFAYFPELRFELSNGRTLCKDCHIKIGFRGHPKRLTGAATWDGYVVGKGE